MQIEPHKIQSELEADEYLEALFAHPEQMSMTELELHAQNRIVDKNIKAYFMSKGKEQLKTYKS